MEVERSVQELNAASKSLEASIDEFKGSGVIADVTGFTKLTELLSKKGRCSCTPLHI